MMYFSSRAPHKTFDQPLCNTNRSERRAELIFTKHAICRTGSQSQCFNFSLHSSLQDLPYSFEEVTRSVTTVAYSQLISLRPIHTLNPIAYFLAEVVSKQILKAYHWVNALEKSTYKDLSENRRPAEVMRFSALLHPLPAILEVVTDFIKMSFITKKNTIFSQTSTPDAVNIIAPSKHRPESSLVHPY